MRLLPRIGPLGCAALTTLLACTGADDAEPELAGSDAPPAPPAASSAVDDSPDDAGVDASVPDAGSIRLVEVVSGTRLRAIYLHAGLGQQFIGWRDTLRNEDCSFAVASDGKTRCLPRSAAGVPAQSFVEASVLATGTARITERFYVADDGAQQLAAFHDAARNEDCSLRVLSDGKTHCVPRSGGDVQRDLDATCTKRLARVTKGKAAPKYAYNVTATPTSELAVGDGFDVFQVGALTTKAYDGLACPKSAAKFADNVDFYVATPLPPSTFAQIDESQDPSGQPRVRYHVMPDGLKVFAGWYDAQKREPCSFAVAPDGLQRCIPESPPGFGGVFGETTFYSDSKCTRPLLLGGKDQGLLGAPPTPTFTLWKDEHQVGHVSTVAATEFAGQGYERASSGACGFVGEFAGYYQLTDVSPSTLAPALSIAPE